MRHSALAALLFSLIFLLSACSREGLLVVTDQYWHQGALKGEGIEQGLVEAGRRGGMSVRVAVLPSSSNTVSKLQAELRGSTAKIVLLSPLLSPDGGELARQFPDKKIVAFESTSSQLQQPSNLIRLVSDPQNAFESAGKRVATYLGSAHGGPRLVVGVFPSNAEGDDALAAFRTGLESGSTQSQLSTIRVLGAVDEPALRRFIEDSRAKNPGLYLLASPALNAFAVQLLKDSTTPIVTEDWIYGSTYSDKVLFSIDKDIPSALRKVVQTMGRPADNEIRISWDLATAPANP